MKKMVLAALVLAAGGTQAKSVLKIAQVSCSPAMSEQSPLTFSASGTVSFEEVLDKTVQTEAKGDLEVTLQEFTATNDIGAVSVSGKATTFPAGEMMSNKSYVLELNSKSIRLFLNGPEGLATSHITTEGKDYFANCMITSSTDTKIDE